MFIQNSSATAAPPIIPLTLQADRVRRRISASDSVAALIAELAFGTRRRGDVGALASLTERVGAPMSRGC